MELRNQLNHSKTMLVGVSIIICASTLIFGIIYCSPKQNDVQIFNSSKEIVIPKHNIRIGLLIEDEEFCFTVIKNDHQILYHRIDVKTEEQSNSISFYDNGGAHNEMWDFNGDGFPDYKIVGSANESMHYAYIENRFQIIEIVNGHNGVNGKPIEFKDGGFQFM